MTTTDAGGPHGYDAGKKVKGRKRHAMVDKARLLLNRFQTDHYAELMNYLVGAGTAQLL